LEKLGPRLFHHPGRLFTVPPCIGAGFVRNVVGRHTGRRHNAVRLILGGGDAVSGLDLCLLLDATGRLLGQDDGPRDARFLVIQPAHLGFKAADLTLILGGFLLTLSELGFQCLAAGVRVRQGGRHVVRMDAQPRPAQGGLTR
jgi:hypothetical protein